MPENLFSLALEILWVKGFKGRVPLFFFYFFSGSGERRNCGKTENKEPILGVGGGKREGQ